LAVAAAPNLAAAKDDYALDDVSREVPRRGRLACPDVELTTYTGKHIAYRQGAKIFTGFQERLERMEKVFAQAAIDVFGRPPHRLVHMGTFNCRRIGGYPQLISEHGLGNAIDVEGFDFAALKHGETLPAGVHKLLRGPFAVRVQSHWKSDHPVLALHAKFLRSAVERMIADKKIFRVLLGPAYPGHHNHFHFDCAPYRMVDVF
jgi:hypothetical protein